MRPNRVLVALRAAARQFRASGVACPSRAQPRSDCTTPAVSYPSRAIRDARKSWLTVPYSGQLVRRRGCRTCVHHPVQ